MLDIIDFYYACIYKDFSKLNLNRCKMDKLLAVFLIVMSGWTISSHLMVLSGQTLQHLIYTAPLVIFCLFIVYFKISQRKIIPSSGNRELDLKTLHNKTLRNNIENYPFLMVLILLCFIPIILYVSWMAFWASAIVILSYCIFQKDGFIAPMVNEIQKPRRWELFTVICFALAAIIITLAVSRSDLDDAFYVAVAAFASSNSNQPLLAFDPMHGDTNLPLIFPSYKFASFELLAGAVAHLLGIPAMDVIYILLPPIAAIMAILCIFLCAQEYLPKRWLALGIITLLLIFVLGETHRAPANMMFVRMFQGKAVYLSAIVPAIFYLTGRYFSKRGKATDLFLLGCCQITAIGLSNFAILAAPMAGFGALISNVPLIDKASRKKLLGVFVTLAIPLPYLIAVAVGSNFGSSVAEPQSEIPLNVWTSVFGSNQQYLAAMLLLIGPVLARDSITRWRLAVPPLLLFAVYLNPWLSNFIAKNITTYPVYWRVVWSFPVLIFAAASLCIVVDRIIDGGGRRFFYYILSIIVIGLFIVSLPFHTLRQENVGFINSFATKKIPVNDYIVAEKAIHVSGNVGRILAPEEISGVISRFEVHPKLVSAREHYLNMFAQVLGYEAYRQRQELQQLVSGVIDHDKKTVQRALTSLNVSTIVIPKINEKKDILDFLTSENYELVADIRGYSIWRLQKLCKEKR